eukprot:461833-Pyramimonas_sp.AAC.1
MDAFDGRIEALQRDIEDIKEALGPEFIKRQRLQQHQNEKKKQLTPPPLYMVRYTMRSDGRTRTSRALVHP